MAGASARMAVRRGILAHAASSLFLFLTVFCRVSHCQKTLIFGIARIIGDSNVHRVNLTSRGDYTEILKVIDNGRNHNSERSDPTLGISTWNPVEKYFYYASSEDGFASGYVTPYDTALNRSLIQRSMRGTTGTSFTLTSLQFNSRDSLLYGVVTYSSGEHFFIRMSVNTQLSSNDDTEVQFVPLIQLDFTHIVPGLSALRMLSGSDGGEEFLHGVGLKDNKAYLFAVRCRSPPRLEWDYTYEIDGVLTSIEADIIDGTLYGMLHNASGHFLLRFDLDGTIVPGAARDASPDSTQGSEPEEEADTELLLGLSSYAPSTANGIEPTYHRFSFSQTLTVNGTREDSVAFTTQNVDYTDFENDKSPYKRVDEPIVNEEGYTLAAIEIGYPRIPELDRALPSVAHITGGMMVTVQGSPFVDTGPKIICRWTPVDGGDPIFSVRTMYIDSGNVICETPAVFTRARTRLELSLTEGLIWTVNYKDFTFFEILSRLPIEGSSKGDTLIQFSGIFFEDLPIRVSAMGEQLEEASCEFGLPPEEGGVEGTYRVISELPQAPQLKRSSCREVAIGVGFQLLCSFACVSPVVPHRPCNPNLFDPEQGCLRFSLLCPSTAQEAAYTCQQLIPNYEFYPFRLRLFGQLIPFEEGWQYTGDDSPILEFARFAPDFTSLILKLDILSDKARMVGGTAPARNFILSADQFLGPGAFAAWVLPNRLRLFFGNGVMFQDDTILSVRPYTIASFFNIYRYVSGIFTPEPLEAADKINPEAQLIVPEDAAQCTDSQVRAGYSKFAGARTLQYLWGLRVGKCIDRYCLNSYQLRERAEPWVAVAQQYVTTQMANPTVDTELAFVGPVEDPALDVIGANRILWILQTRNLLYDERALDLSRDECFAASGNIPDDCRLCLQNDPDVCPGVSTVAAQPMRIHLSAPPSGVIKAPSYLEVTHGDLSLMAGVSVPNSAEGSQFIHRCERALSFPNIQDLNVLQQSMEMRWQVDELILPDVYDLESVQRLALSSYLTDTTLSANTIDLAGFGIFSSTSTLKLQKAVVQPGHFYRVSFSVEGSDESDTRLARTSTVVFVKRRDIRPKVSVHFSRAGTISTYQGTDNVFVTAERAETINVSAADTEGLDTLGPFTTFQYRWSCRMWPGVTEEYRYWDDFEGEDRPLGSFPCEWNNTDIFGGAYDGPYMAAETDHLLDKQTYEFKLEIILTGLDTTQPDGAETFRAVQRVTIMRRDSLEFWSTVEMQIRAADGINRHKARPGEPLIVNYRMDLESFLDANRHLGGRCRAELPCSFIVEERGNLVDLNNNQVTNSMNSVIFEDPPGEQAIIMKPLVVVSGVRFVFRVTLYQAGLPRGIAELQVDVNAIPRAGRFEVSPISGQAFADEFSMVALEWEDDEEDLPLGYAFSYVLAEEDPAYIDDYYPRTSISSRLPMKSDVAARFPCPEELSGGFPCSMVKLRVYIRDVWDAEAVSEVEVPISLGDRSQLWESTHGTFLEGMSNGMLGKNFGAMLASFTMTSTALGEDSNRGIVVDAALADPTLYNDQQYQDAMLDAIIDFAAYENGQLFEITPVLASQLSGAVDAVTQVTGTITDDQRSQLFELVERSSSALATIRVPLSILSQIILTAANLMQGNLARGLELRNNPNRRLMQTADPLDLVHESNLMFLENVTLPVCRSALLTAVADADEPTTIDNNHLFYVSFARIGTSDGNRDTIVNLPKSDTCDEIQFIHAQWKNAVNRNFCFTVFKYNPVDYTSQTTADRLNDGTVQGVHSVPWPLHPNSCPLQFRFQDPLTGEALTRPGDISIKFQIPVDAARTVFYEEQNYNGLVFLDVMFSASCQEWVEASAQLPSQGMWSLFNTTTQILDSEPNLVCNASHWPEFALDEPPPLASGAVMCWYPRENDPPAQRRSLFGVITEQTDCLGEVDTPLTKPDGVEWNDGQFAFVAGVASDRKVCDRCLVCGGQNECELFCDNKVDSGSKVDLCGVCGGACVGPDCFQQDCSKPYVRYLGHHFPLDWDVGTDGFTDGLFFYDGPCEGPAPVTSPEGICSDKPVGDLVFRTEQYPYNSGWKICWENSPIVPPDSPDAKCRFQRDSLRVDEPSGVFLNRTLSIWALDHEGNVGELDRIAAAPLDAKVNGSNPLQPSLFATAPVLQGQLSLLEFAPEEHWNSHYPPERVRSVVFSLGEDGRTDTYVEVTIRPVNDPPKIVAPPDPYVVQEDRPTQLRDPWPIYIDDDGDDVAGTTIRLLITAVRDGAGIRIGGDDEFGSRIEIDDTVANVNLALRRLQYLSPENSNDDYEPWKGQILLNVSDNGSGGEYPYNESFSDVKFVNMTTKIANDPPIPIMPRSVSIFQNGSASVLGGHIVDVDMWQHAARRYQSILTLNQGEISVGLFRNNCTVKFNQPLRVGIPQRLNFVDEKIQHIDGMFGRSGDPLKHLFMKLSGRVGWNKFIYLMFELENFDLDLLAEKATSFVVSMFKNDCYDSSADQGALAATAQSMLADCSTEGEILVSVVDCEGLTEDAPFLWHHHLDVPILAANVGSAEFSATRLEWVDAILDADRVVPHISDKGLLCLQFAPPPELNETHRYFGLPFTTVDTTNRRNGREENLYPKLEVILGFGGNLSKTQANCSVNVTHGTGTLDRTFGMEGNTDASNAFLNNITFSIISRFSNMLGGTAATLTLTVRDLVGYQECLEQQVEFGEQGCDVPQSASTQILIVPYKEERINAHMQPWYSERWLRAKSVRGEVPTVVAFEDCGNRGWEEECPDRMQYIPEFQEGEYRYGVFTVEFSSRLGTFTVPEEIRPSLNFEKGDGFRDGVLRFSGFAPDVRKAMMDMIYHTRLDESLQYKNVYSSEHLEGSIPCSRTCFFNDIAPPTFQQEDEAIGCSSGCSAKIYDRTNNFTIYENGIFLDDIVVTFSDNGVTGIGLTAYTTILMYNVYTVAANDNPCIIFRSRISEGCREDCAHTGLPFNCDDSGLPFDLDDRFNTTMYEGQEEPILLGGLVAKNVDEFESTRIQCRTELAENLARRGDGVEDPVWLDECPKLNVIITAKVGWTSLNSREFINIYLGADQSFWSPIAFLGYTIDVNAATRMLRYRMSDGNQFFNNNQGTEVVTIQVLDQGFSGADPTGEFDGTNAQSLLSFTIDIIPVNNLPFITVPRSSDPINVLENVVTQLSASAEAPGLNITDVDSDECDGILEMTLEVKYGRLFVLPIGEPGFTALASSSQDRMDFFADPSCSDEDCSVLLNSGTCRTLNRCQWLLTENRCRCKQVRAGNMCNKLKMRGLQGDIQAAMQAVLYVPREQTNTYSYPEPESMMILASDKVDPFNPSDHSVSCGETLGIDPEQPFPDELVFAEAEAMILVVPVNQPPSTTHNPRIHNSDFETPEVCEGFQDCTDDLVQPDMSLDCVGVLATPNELGWTMIGSLGVSFTGWEGDVPAAVGRQHLWMAPSADQSAAISQDIEGIVIGSHYKMSAQVGARSTANGGAALTITLGDFLDNLPSITIDLVQYVLGRDSTYYESNEFIARKEDYLLEIRSFITAEMKPPNGRLNFIDDVQIQFLRYNMLEGDSLRFSAFRVLDADAIPGIQELLVRNGGEFDILVTLTCKYGIFSLELDECSVVPHETGEDQIDKIREWGVRCGLGFYGDVAISEWANASVAFRSPCPVGWTGQGTADIPCVNLPLTTLNTSWSLYDPEDFPRGQSHIPSRVLQLAGTLENLEYVVRNKVNYVPDLYFNTENLGKEEITVFTNDRGNFNGDPIETTQRFPIFVKAVNNQPNVTFSELAMPILEDEPIKITGIQFDDPDVDEIFCIDEPCDPGKGFLALLVRASNGSLLHDDQIVTADLDEMVSTAFLPFTDNMDLILCMWKLSCISQSGYLTLASDDLTTFCKFTPERCDQVVTYCTIASMGLQDVDTELCRQTIGSEFFVEIELPEMRVLEQNFQDRLLAHLEQQSMVSVVRPRYTLFVGSMSHLRFVFDNNLVTYVPDNFFNGIQPIEFVINDLANQGIGCPANGAFRIPVEMGGIHPGLYWDHCSNTYPVFPLSASRSWDIEIQPINNPPVLYQYNEGGTAILPEFEPMNAVTNVTRFLHILEVVDPDIEETPGCVMNVEVGTRSGGRMSFNSSKAPLLQYLPNIYGTLLAVEGSIHDVNVFLQNIEYTSDLQFNGIEALVFDIFDNGCTGADRDDASSGIQTFILEVNVVRPKTCQFTTCEECIGQVLEICGWCPASCEGRGKCRDAVSIGGPPRYGECPVLCTEEGCVGWNQCKPDPDRSWIIGAIGSPLLLIFLVGLYTLFMWARREHGTIPLWANKALRTTVRMLTHVSFSPKEGSRYGQLTFLWCAYILAGMLPPVFNTLFLPDRTFYSLGEALTFTLVTDHCDVKFVGSASLNRSDPATVALLLNKIDDVVVSTDFCEDDQFIRINNTRIDTVRYVGYLCEVEFLVPEDPGHTLPAMSIINVGSKATTVTTANEGQFVNFGPNQFSFNGTVINLVLSNLATRKISVPNLERGNIDIRNSTFTGLDIRTTRADVFVSVSPDLSMLVPFSVDYLQPDNRVCFMGKNEQEAHQQENACSEDCSNRSYWELISEEIDGNLIQTNQTGWEIVCEWRCERYSMARLIPYKRDLQPGLSDIFVEIRSEFGQIYFSAIPDQRVPPASGRTLLDNVYVYDGLIDTLPSSAQRENLRQKTRDLAIDPVAQALVDEAFHPGGAPAPKEQWYELVLTGPAAPPGLFVWVSDVRYVVLDRLLLQVLSLGMLTPTQGLSLLTLSTSPCPHADLGAQAEAEYVSAPLTYDTPLEAESTRRKLLQDDEVNGVGNSQYLKRFYRLLFEAVDGLEIPSGSMIVYKPPGDDPFIGFGLDTETGEVTVTQVVIDDYPLIQLLIGFGIAIPAFASLVFTCCAVIKGRRRIKLFRERKFQKEHTARLLLDLRSHKELTEAQKHAKEKELEELKQDLYNKTNFFYFLDYQIGDPDKAQSLQAQIKFAFIHLCVVGGAILPMLIFALNYTYGRHTFVCPLQPDKAACIAEWTWPGVIIYALVVVHAIISYCELYCFYANLPWRRWRKALRLLWYASQAIMMFLSITYLMVVVTWIFIGLLVTPSQYLPYVIGFSLSIGVLYRYIHRTLAEQRRLRMAIFERVKVYSKGDFGRVPPVVVDNILDRQVHLLLKKRHLSGTAVTRGATVIFVVLFAVQVFLFVGFHALTDINDLGLGLFKTIMTAVAILAVDAVVNRKRDFVIKKQDMSLLVYEIVTEAKKNVAFVKHQVDLGELLVIAMRKRIRDAEKQERAEAVGKDVEVGGLNFNPDDWYKMPTAAAKTMIHDDRYAPGADNRIAVEVAEVEPQVDMSALPKPYEPETYQYHPDYYKDKEEEGAVDRPTVVMFMEGDDEGAAEPEQLAMLLAQILGVSEDRFAIEVQDI